jgi:heme-degrading monooxygenase HmoA
MAGSNCVEVAMFKLRSGVDRARFIADGRSAGAALQRYPGYVGRQLTHSADDDQWIDIVQWRSKQEATSAAEAVMAEREAGPFLTSIDVDSIRMFHATPVA